MDPSYKNNLGSALQGGAGSASPNSSDGRTPIVSGAEQGAIIPDGNGFGGVSSGAVSGGTGDIILNGGAEKKSKKWWIVGGVVGAMIVAAIIGGIMLVKNNGTDVSKIQRQEMHQLLGEHRDGVASLTSLMEAVYGDGFSLSDFMLDESVYAEKINSLDESIADLSAIEDRMNGGPMLSGTFFGIDLATNYEGLKNALSNTGEQYRRLAEVTKEVYETFQGAGEVSAVETLGEYDAMYDFAMYIDTFFENRRKILQNYTESGCNTLENAECQAISAELGELMNSAATKNVIIQAAFAGVVGEIDNDDRPLIYYINNLYTGTGDSAEVGGENAE